MLKRRPADKGITQKQKRNYATQKIPFNSLNADLNPICHLLALLGAHPILHISRIMIKYAKP
jgi:hypothetical protein